VAGGVAMAKHLERPWLKGDLRRWLACSDTYDAEKPTKELVGANMAFSRRILKEVPSFDPELGAGAMGCGEESLFSCQLIKAGFRIVELPTVTVEHHFDEIRLCAAEFLKMARKLGRSHAYIAQHWKHESILTSFGALLHAVLFHCYRFASGRSTEVFEGLPAWKLDLALRMAFFRQHLIECLRPRNYVKHGLIKERGHAGLKCIGSNPFER
jgi:hypothetical protein